MGHWVKDEDDSSVLWWFAYRQKKLVDIEDFIRSNPQHTNLYQMRQFRKLYHLAIAVEDYRYPIFSYFCEFMVISIRKWKDGVVFMSWASGDDDIGYHLDFQEKNIPMVKKFISENYKNPNFGKLIIQFASENNFSYY